VGVVSPKDSFAAENSGPGQPMSQMGMGVLQGRTWKNTEVCERAAEREIGLEAQQFQKDLVEISEALAIHVMKGLA